MKKQQGFTLIELVVVIVILGILAATALPKFVDVSTEAGDAAAAGTAAAYTSAAAMNYAKYLASGGGTGSTDIKSDTATCSDLDALVTKSSDVSWVTKTATISCTNPKGAGGSSTACKLEHSKGTAGGTTSTVVTAICTS